MNDIVVGMLFGDEGKGTIVDFLSSQQETNAVVRFSGGAQAAHNVIVDGKHHTFAQFGSGTLRGVPTILTEYMMVNPFNMAKEADALWDITGVDPFEKTLISSHSLLTTPIHAAANVKREQARGVNRHGSCGQGIGETMSYSLKHPVAALTMNDLKIPGFLEAKLDLLRKTLESELGELDLPDNSEIIAGYVALLNDRPVNIVSNDVIYGKLHEGYNVFEGSQGVLLDENYGFHPYTTWSTVTPQNAQRVLHDAGLPSGRVIGVTRSYTTRHGAGPFPTEITDDKKFPEKHNGWGELQGSWRVGPLDLVLLNYASQVVKNVDMIALTHADSDFSSVVTSYDNGQYCSLPVSPPESSGWKNQRSFQEGLTTLLGGFASHEKDLGNNITEQGLPKPIIGDVDVTHVDSLDSLIGLVEFATGSRVGIISDGPNDTDKRFI